MIKKHFLLLLTLSFIIEFEQVWAQRVVEEVSLQELFEFPPLLEQLESELGLR